MNLNRSLVLFRRDDSFHHAATLLVRPCRDRASAIDRQIRVFSSLHSDGREAAQR
jgi:hypothetical protein